MTVAVASPNSRGAIVEVVLFVRTPFLRLILQTLRCSVLHDCVRDWQLPYYCKSNILQELHLPDWQNQEQSHAARRRHNSITKTGFELHPW
jgi:hypothetical protein